MTILIAPVASGLEPPDTAPLSPSPLEAVERAQRASSHRLALVRERAEALRVMADATKLRAASLLCESRLLRDAIASQCCEQRPRMNCKSGRG